jgi:hypothetical protein
LQKIIAIEIERKRENDCGGSFFSYQAARTTTSSVI